MLKSVRMWRIAGAVGVSLGLCAIGHAQSYNPYTGSGPGLQGELRDQRAAVVGLNLKVPFGMQSNARDVSSQPRLSLGINFTEPAFGYERVGNDFDFSMGLTFSGEQYVALNGRPIPAYMLASYLDEAEDKTGATRAC